MTEAPPEGLYPRGGVEGRIDPDGGVELRLGRPGPAGLSQVELSDGSVWAVDHADPGSPVGLEVPSSELVAWPLVVAAFGGDGALFLTDRLSGRGGDGEPVAPASTRSPARSPARVAHPGAASAAGRLVVLWDLATDPELDLLARIAAAVELCVAAPEVEGGDLVVPLRDRLVRTAAELAAQLDDDDLGAVPAPLAARLADLVRSVAGGASELDRSLLRLLALLEERSREDVADVARVASLRPAGLAPAEDLPAAAGPVPTVDGSAPGAPRPWSCERVGPALVEVRAARSPDRPDAWVRVRRREGLVTLAQAPMERDGLMLVAVLAVPPDTTEEELVVEVCDRSDLGGGPGPPPPGADAVRAAVLLGREAARADRVGSPSPSGERWWACAEAWDVAGDPRRAEQARELATPARGRRRSRSGPLLADEIVEAGGVDP